MKIRILGAHMFESRDTRLTSFLIDNVLAVDAGGLTSSLAFTEQERLRFILLTHGHYDHIRDIPAFALRNRARTTDVYATRFTLDLLSNHLMDGTIYPKFAEWPSPEEPVLRLHALEPFRAETVGEYSIMTLPVNHSIPAVGFQVTDSGGDSIFITGDTGPGLASCWEYVNPRLIIVDMAFSNKSEESAAGPGHLCPSLLGKELEAFRDLKGYLPQVVLAHLNPDVEGEIRDEAVALASEIGTDISLACEGLEL